MPTYEYRCPEGHQFEKFQKITEKPRAKCPVCGKAATRVISGGAGLVFRGSGFYITDYRSKSYQEAAKKETSSTTPKPSANGSETKSTAKKEAKNVPSQAR